MNRISNLILLTLFAWLSSCALKQTVNEEDLSIRISTTTFLPLVVDSLRVVYGIEGESQSHELVVPCSTSQSTCIFTITHDPKVSLGFTAQAYANGINIGFISTGIQSSTETIDIANVDSLFSDSVAKARILQSQCVSGTPNCMTDSRSGGRNYRTVAIGSQVWMAENLDYFIPDNAVQNAYSYCYDNNPVNCALRGRLYNWKALFDGAVAPGERGICPAGWHLPTDPEWTTLEMTAGLTAADTAIYGLRGAHASNLRAPSPLWGPSWETLPADNSTGFSAIPGGLVDKFGESGFLELETGANFWTSTSVDATISGVPQPQAIKRKISPDDAGLRRDFHHQVNAYNLRCLKD
jgi:uncharacterized protein (TIGR02145 family)